MAVEQWQTITSSSECPDYAELVRARALDPGVSRDGGADFRIACSSGEVSVVWAGRDREFGSLDDETAPDPLGAPKALVLSKLGAAPLLALPLSMLLSALVILATLLRLRVAASASRAASIGGWLVILVGLGCGSLDLMASRVRATRRRLSRADTERCRSRGNNAFLAEAAWAPSLASRARISRRCV
jgi:hypothetical protein